MEIIAIGEKIHKLRLQKKMTQKELAGDAITRNMLSRIETGAALPSLPTMQYLAERLGVPAGFLLAEGDDDRAWRRIGHIGSVRRAFRRGDYALCLSLCRSEGDHPDEEMYLMMAESGLALAEEAMREGRLRAACRLLDNAVEYAEKTMYDTAPVRGSATLYFRFLHGISPQLSSDRDLPVSDLLTGNNRPFGRYILAREALEAGESRLPEAYLQDAARGEAEDGWHLHLAAHRALREGEFQSALAMLTRLLNTEAANSEILLYCVFCDLEIACRETGDFKGAYEYSQNKVMLLERMLTGSDGDGEYGREDE